jgi:pimeloyl-ACP methyl ester carboxylesterase
MAAFVLIPGAGSDSWYWHLVVSELLDAGHDVVPVDLPCDGDSATFTDYANTVVDAIGDRKDLVLVAQSLGGFTAPLVCEHVPVQMLVLVNAMIPLPGESAGDWWANTGQPQAMHEEAARHGRSYEDDMELMNDFEYIFLHDLPADVKAESEKHVRNQSGRPFADPLPIDQWPNVPTRALAGRHDRLFPVDFQRTVAKERLGIEIEAIDGGHLLALSRPSDVANRLLGYLR